MPDRNTKIQIAFRYRTIDSPSGVTRRTAKRLAEHLGVDETQAIHQALHERRVFDSHCRGRNLRNTRRIFERAGVR